MLLALSSAAFAWVQWRAPGGVWTRPRWIRDARHLHGLHSMLPAGGQDNPSSIGDFGYGPRPNDSGAAAGPTRYIASSAAPLPMARVQPPAESPPRAPRSSRGAADRNILRKIVDSQITDSTTAEPINDPVWSDMRRDAEMECRKEPLLSSFMSSAILNHKSLEAAVAFHMANKLATPTLIGTQIQSLFMQCFEENPSFRKYIRSDIMAVMDRDPACRSYLDALLYFKGFQALQTHRVAHWLWKKGRDTLAFYMQSQVNRLFQIDIHPAARVGEGVFIDHGTGIVIGETAVVGNNVSMLHMVTLGGSGKKHVDRHPKIGDGVLLGAGSTILGNVRVGSRSLVGACSLVLEDIPPNCVAVGVPAKVVGYTTDGIPAQSMQQVDAVSPPAWVEGIDYII